MSKWTKVSFSVLLIIAFGGVAYYLFFWPYSVQRDRKALISKSATGRTLGKVKFDIHDGEMSPEKLKNKSDTRFYEFGKAMQKNYEGLKANIYSNVVASTSDSSYFVVWHGEEYGPQKFTRDTEGPAAYSHKLILYDKSLNPIWETNYTGRIVDISKNAKNVMIISQNPVSPGSSYQPSLKTSNWGSFVVVIDKSGKIIFKETFSYSDIIEISGGDLSKNGEYLAFLVRKDEPTPVNVVNISTQETKEVSPPLDEWHKSCRLSGGLKINNNSKLIVPVRCQGGIYTWKQKVSW